MVAFLDFAVRIEQRLDQIIHRRARANRRQVRSYLSADTANGVAGDASEFGPPKYVLPTRRVALRRH